MAKNQTVRIKPSLLKDDIDAFSALQDISTYAPANVDFTVANGTAKQTAMQGEQLKEAQAEAALKSAHDNSVASEWDFHNYMLGVKKQVMAQYGDSSNELQALGLKKKTEYKSPHHKAKASGGGTTPVQEK